MATLIQTHTTLNHHYAYSKHGPIRTWLLRAYVSLWRRLIVAVATYVIVGCLVNAFARQKRGIEIIPNLEFWKDFPFLLKDGIVFTFTFPCQKYKERRQGYESM
jgi:hypothetical protein